jgi:CRP/FNR family transcriptional regulator, cyclic AMP receptor protein
MSLYTENGECEACEFRESLDLLRQSSFLAALPLDALKLFAYLCRREFYRAGEELVVAGEDDGRAFLIIEGTVCLIQPEPKAFESIGNECIKQYEPGEFLGCLSLLGDLRRLYTLKAETDTRCLVLTRELFFKAMNQFPDLWPRVFTGLLGRIRSWEIRLLEIADTLPDSVRERLGATLL